MWVCCVNACVYSYVYAYMWVYTRIFTCTCRWRTCMSVLCVCVLIPFLSVFSCVIQRYRPFGEIRTCCGRLNFVFVVDLIHWRFKDRPIRWSRGSYRFVQWRPDGNSDSKSRHFMWVSVLILFSYLLWTVDIYMLLVLFDHLIYFTSVIMRIISWVISQCSL